MDLLSISGAIWRHKLVTIPLIAFILLGALYVVKFKAPVYNSSSSFLLVNPPGPPTAAQIAANPRLGKVNTNNPYANFGDLNVTADAVLSVLTSPSSQQALAEAGADPRYQAALSSAFGTPPIIQITGVGSSAQEAIKTANLVTNAAITDLHQLQKSQGVNPSYMITSVKLVPPIAATKSSSGKLRTLIALVGLGVILLFVAVSVMDVIGKRRKDDVRSANALAGAPVTSAPVGSDRVGRDERRKNETLTQRTVGSRSIIRAKSDRPASRDAEGHRFSSRRQNEERQTGISK
jgi:hypothetical protein